MHSPISNSFYSKLYNLLYPTFPKVYCTVYRSNFLRLITILRLYHYGQLYHTYFFSIDLLFVENSLELYQPLSRNFFNLKKCVCMNYLTDTCYFVRNS